MSGPHRLVDLQHGYRRMGRSHRLTLRYLREQVTPPTPVKQAAVEPRPARKVTKPMTRARRLKVYGLPLTVAQARQVRKTDVRLARKAATS